MDLPPDPEEMNDARAEWAGRAVAEFARATRIEEEDARTQLMDMMTDLRHWADRQGINFDRVVVMSGQHYEEETREG